MRIDGNILLAVVIPTYKATFLEETLQSFVNQSDNRFNVYIGDDSSPEDVFSVVSRFQEKLKIHYHRFSENLGGKDLVAHWHRCVELTKKEAWVWLFTDDDIPGSKCVELLLKHIEMNGEMYDLYRFQKAIVNKNGEILRRFPSVKEGYVSSFDLFKDDFNAITINSLPEFVFSRAIYLCRGGFLNFPLAWGSDSATWYSFSLEKGCYSIPFETVHFRNSGLNISSIDEKYKYEKLTAYLLRCRWLLGDYFPNLKRVSNNSLEGYKRQFEDKFYALFLSMYNALPFIKSIKTAILFAKVFTKPMIVHVPKLVLRNFIRLMQTRKLLN